MEPSVYEELLEVMTSRRGPYAGLDIPEFFELVKELFTPEEAEVNNILSKKPETLEQIALKAHRDPYEIEPLLETMAGKGLCATFMREGQRVYQGLPFMPGILEYQFLGGREADRDRKLARLIHEYKSAYVAARGVAKIAFPVTRVIPVDKTIDAGNRIHTYDQVATYIQKYDSIGVGSCYCRHAANSGGRTFTACPWMSVCGSVTRQTTWWIAWAGGRSVKRKPWRFWIDRRRPG